MGQVKQIKKTFIVLSTILTTLTLSSLPQRHLCLVHVQNLEFCQDWKIWLTIYIVLNNTNSRPTILYDSFLIGKWWILSSLLDCDFTFVKIFYQISSAWPQDWLSKGGCGEARGVLWLTTRKELRKRKKFERHKNSWLASRSYLRVCC